MNLTLKWDIILQANWNQFINQIQQIKMKSKEEQDYDEKSIELAKALDLQPESVEELTETLGEFLSEFISGKVGFKKAIQRINLFIEKYKGEYDNISNIVFGILLYQLDGVALDLAKTKAHVSLLEIYSGIAKFCDCEEGECKNNCEDGSEKIKPAEGGFEQVPSFTTGQA